MNVFKFYIEKLSSIYDVDEANAIAHQIFKHVISNKQQDYLLLNFENISFSNHFSPLQSILIRLINNEPLQHILGNVPFLDCEILVNKNVLIPRPETEELVFLLHKKTRHLKEIKVIDICSGSGCIAIAIAKANPSFKVFGLDKSEKAVAVAKRNAELNNTKVTFISENIFDWKSDFEFDFIISNPPYIMQNEKTAMHNNVLNYEPHMALFVEDTNVLIFYKEIKRIAIESLKKGGEIYLEINPILASETCQLFNDNNFKANIQIDMYGKQRFVIAVKS